MDGPVEIPEILTGPVGRAAIHAYRTSLMLLDDEGAAENAAGGAALRTLAQLARESDPLVWAEVIAALTPRAE